MIVHGVVTSYSASSWNLALQSSMRKLLLSNPNLYFQVSLFVSLKFAPATISYTSLYSTEVPRAMEFNRAVYSFALS